MPIFGYCYTKLHGEVLWSLLLLIYTLTFFIQALTTLNLSNNQIESDGVKHLADALQINKVNHIVFPFPPFLSTFDSIDNQCTSSWR
jgi:hypothetical protein